MNTTRLLRSAITIVISLLSQFAFGNAARIVSLSTCENISEKGMVPQKITDQFTTDAPGIHAVIVLDQVKSGLIVKGIWISVDAIETPDCPIDSTVVKLKDKETRAHFALSRPTNGWPQGNYRLDIYFDDNFITSAPFSVSANKDPKAAGGKKQATKTKQPQKGSTDLLGKWECQTQYGSSYLEFKSKNKLVLDGEQFAYSISGSTLKVEDETGVNDYPFTLKDSVLTIKFDEGFSMAFKPTDKIPEYEADEEPVYEENQAQSRPSQEGSSDLMQHFAGTWWNATTNTETNVTLTSDGRYIESSTSSYSGSSSDQYGNPDMSWGRASDNSAQGTWTVRGDTREGEIIITYQDGSQKVFPYQVHVENGEVYWSEYYFNGVLYGKK